MGVIYGEMVKERRGICLECLYASRSSVIWGGQFVRIGFLFSIFPEENWKYGNDVMINFIIFLLRSQC